MGPVTLRSILVATDLSESAEKVLHAAAALAARAGAALHVLHAFDFQRLPYADENIGGVTFAGRIHDTERALDAQLARTLPAGVDVASREVVIYSASKAIAERAAQVDADVVIIGPHRRRAVGDLLLGSTADHAIRTLGVPCLVVRGPFALPLRRVLAPLDLSEPARAALDVALGWAASFGVDAGDAGAPATEVAFLHVIPTAYWTPTESMDADAIAATLSGEVRSALERTGTVDTLSTREEVAWGDTAAEEVVRRAAAEESDLIVLATHGHGAVRRALIGSVASRVARSAPCPVLLVPPAVWERATNRAGD